jgi:hypothetical protein
VVIVNVIVIGMAYNRYMTLLLSESGRALFIQYNSTRRVPVFFSSKMIQCL